MWDFSIAKTLSILGRTMPFILLRMAVYFGFTFAYIIATGAGAGVGYGIGQIGSEPGSFAVWGGIAGFGIVSAIVYWIREYILYMVKAGHIAVMVEMLDGRPIADGKGQVAHARDVAVMRAHRAGAVCVLGSATPSMESVANANAGKYTRLEMPERVPVRGPRI